MPAARYTEKNQGDVLQRPPGAKEARPSTPAEKEEAPSPPPVRKSAAFCASAAARITSAAEPFRICRSHPADMVDVVKADDEHGPVIEYMIGYGFRDLRLIHIFCRRPAGQVQGDPREDRISCPVNPAVNIDRHETRGQRLNLGEDHPHACGLPGPWWTSADDASWC